MLIRDMKSMQLTNLVCNCEVILAIVVLQVMRWIIFDVVCLRVGKI